MGPILFIIGWCIFTLWYEKRYEQRFNERRRRRLGLR